VLSVPVLRRALLVIAAAVAACLVAVVAACSGAPGDRAPARPVPMVALDDHLFSLTWEGDSVCLHGAFPTLPACAPVDARSTEAVLSALLQPLDAGADVLVVVTRPAVALDGLGARVVRTLMAPAGGRLGRRKSVRPSEKGTVGRRSSCTGRWRSPRAGRPNVLRMGADDGG
jgi:hypothetical protein